MSCQPSPVVMLRRHAHRRACGRGAKLIRSPVQTGLEEAAWKRQEPAARGRLIAVQRERRPPAAARRLIASECRQRERGTRERRNALQGPEQPIAAEPRLTARELSLARRLCAAPARRQPEHVPSLTAREPKLARTLSAGSVRRKPEYALSKLWRPVPEPLLVPTWQ